jgi:hypothetical protein
VTSLIAIKKKISAQFRLAGKITLAKKIKRLLP